MAGDRSLRLFLLLASLSLPAIATAQIGMRGEWEDNSLTEDGFRLERRPDPGAPEAFVEVATVGADETVAVDPGPLSEATSYCWRVVAFNDAGEGIGREACETTPLLPPRAPTGLTFSIVLPPGTLGGVPDPTVLRPEESPQPDPTELPQPPETGTIPDPLPPPP